MTEDKIFKTVRDANVSVGMKTLHPLVSVIDYSETPIECDASGRYEYGVYAIYLKDTKCGDMKYGNHYYDYQEGTLVFFAPGQTTTIAKTSDNRPQGYSLMFDKMLLRGTALAKTIANYSFFGYEVNEALHLSDEERQIVLNCFHNIDEELHRGIDRMTQTLIVQNIELFLNYCTRFYERQFLTRQPADKDVIVRFQELLSRYFTSDLPREKGMPTVRYFADQLCLSPNYFGDLIKKDTGRSPQDHIQNQLIETAKDIVMDSTKSINEIAYSLGFEYPQYFSRLFKKKVGVTPNEFRLQNIK